MRAFSGVSAVVPAGNEAGRAECAQEPATGQGSVGEAASKAVASQGVGC